MSANERIRVRNLNIYRPIIYGNTARVMTPEEKQTAPPDHTHKWTVAVRSAASVPGSDAVGGADDLSYFIRRVTFKLHDTYPNPTRSIEKPPFELTETGWGEFEILIRITFIAEAGEKAMQLYHHLKLHPWPAPGEPEIPPIDVARAHGPVHSWQYDEIVFNDPFQNFLNILTANPPTPLPRAPRRPVPFHIAAPGSLAASKGGTPEFNTQMEREEHARLEEAKRQVAVQTEAMRRLLIEKQSELRKLEEQLAAG
ncbi:yeats family-domain-containing protein [Schizophyllum amplum]|uniref:Protein AF-9 homolog n=1 Tax=Schizophyllum amplum TaxID=97359 RepID=A0A550CSS1_9AGAR|nr:yeats family-domain-containing protein [Auriculariopsis ampla]